MKMDVIFCWRNGIIIGNVRMGKWVRLRRRWMNVKEGKIGEQVTGNEGSNVWLSWALISIIFGPFTFNLGKRASYRIFFYWQICVIKRIGGIDRISLRINKTTAASALRNCVFVDMNLIYRKSAKLKRIDWHVFCSRNRGEKKISMDTWQMSRKV